MDNKEFIKAFDEIENTISLPNAWTRAIWPGSLLVNNLFMLSIVQSKQNERGDMVAEIPASIACSLLKIKSNNKYTVLKQAAIGDPAKPDKTCLLDFKIRYFDEAAETFRGLNVYQSIEYENSQLKFTFNSSLTEQLSNTKDKYTVTLLMDLLSFERKYAQRLYHIMDTHYFKLKTKSVVKVDFELGHLMALTGCFDNQLEYVVQAMERGVPWNTIYEMVKEKGDCKNADIRDFNRRVLKKAVNIINTEHNESGEPYKFMIDYETHGKPISRYTISIRNRPTMVPERYEDKKTQEFMTQINLILGKMPISENDTIAIANAAKGDLLKIKKAVKVYESYREKSRRNGKDVLNIAGFILKAIQEEWDVSSVSYKSESDLVIREICEKLDFMDDDQAVQDMMERYKRELYEEPSLEFYDGEQMELDLEYEEPVENPDVIDVQYEEVKKEKDVSAEDKELMEKVRKLRKLMYGLGDIDPSAITDEMILEHMKNLEGK